MSATSSPAVRIASAVDHYENFPVASWLCPPRLRPPITAIYWFARTADDLADEGDAPAAQRLQALDAMRADVLACAHGATPSGRWPQVFEPLAQAMHSHALPAQPLLDLLSAFEQDVQRTRDAQGYRDREELRDYCRRSANPVGRLLLHLWGITDAASQQRSDAICTGLQLVNFWQDLASDLSRGRHYLPHADLLAHGLAVAIDQPALLGDAAFGSARAQLLRSLCVWARTELLLGAPLALAVPGRAGWELRLVVQGGLRVLDKIAARGHDTLAHRPTLNAWDMPPMLWHAARMRAAGSPR